MIVSSDAYRQLSDKDYLERAYWGMQTCLFLIKQANKRMNQAIALECGIRYAYWQERAIAFASR